MPSYQYEAADATGRIERGLIDADSERHARQLLRTRGLLPLAVRGVATSRNGSVRRLGAARLRDGELGSLTRQLAGLLAAGLPRASALSAPLYTAARPNLHRFTLHNGR